MTTKGFPELQRHFQLLGVPENAMLISRTDFGHNYNHVCRAAMYAWFNRHLKLGFDEPVLERDYQRLTQQEMTIWNDEHPRPKADPEFERKLLRYWWEDSQQQLAALAPTDEASLRKYREVVGGALDIVIGRNLLAAEDIEYEEAIKTDRGNYFLMAGLLRNKPQGEELPVLFLHPKKWQGELVVWLHDDGKSGLFGEHGEPVAAARLLVDAGATVVGVDLLYQGEFLADGKPIDKTRRVKNPREAAAYSFGYNHTLFARRVHDVLTVLSFIKNHELEPKSVNLVGLDGAGPWVAAARAQAGDVVTKAVVDTGGFRFGKVSDLYDPWFLPGGAKYGDVLGMLAVAAPHRLLLAGEGNQVPALVGAVYHAADADDRVVAFDGGKETITEYAVDWLLKK